MTYFKNKNKWFWAFIVLLVLNIAAIGTMVYTLNEIHKDVDMSHNNENFRNTPDKTIMRKNMAKRFQKRMGYTDEQMKTLKDIRLKHMQNMKNIKRELTKAQMNLFDELSSDSPDSGKIKFLKKQIIDAEQKIIDESISFYNKVKENSTPEQMRKMNKFYKRHLFHHGLPVHNYKGKK